jgi:hypothetical protein
MGRSIHAFIEFGDESLVLCHAEVHIMRHYDLFSILDKFPQRGLPEKIGGATHGKFFLMTASPENAEIYKQEGSSGIRWMLRSEADKHVEAGDSFYRKSEATGEDFWVSDPYWYDANWLTLEECEEALRLYRQTSNHVNLDFPVVVETMKAIESYVKQGSTRLVFWYDV